MSARWNLFYAFVSATVHCAFFTQAALECDKSPSSCFLCKNIDFKPVNISKTQVGDSKCDCCDGSDENSIKPYTCKNTCKAKAVQYVKKRSKEKRDIQEGLEVRSSIIRRSYRRIASWKNELKFLKQDMKQLKRVRERIKHRRYAELAVERFIAETLYIAEEEAEKSGDNDGEDVEWVFKKIDGRFMAVREDLEITDTASLAKETVLDKYKNKIAKEKNIEIFKARREADSEVIDLDDLQGEEARKAGLMV